MRLFLFSIIMVVFVGAKAQETKFSVPQSMPYGINHAAVLGTCSSGIIVREYGKGSNWIECYDNDLNQKWRKELVILEKSPDVEEVFLSGDSIVVFYTTYSHGKYILKSNLYSSNFFILKNAYVIDTLPPVYSNENFEMNYILSFDKRKVLIFYVNSDFDTNHKVFYDVISNSLDNLHRSTFTLPAIKYPAVLDGLIGDDYTAYFICGNKEAGNLNNDYNYTELGVEYVLPGGIQKYLSFPGNGKLFSVPETKLDLVNKRFVISGLYADEPGNEGNGTFYLRAGLRDTVVYAKQMIPFTDAFIAYMNGSAKPKRNESFQDFKTTDLIVKRDGGVMLVTESQSQNTETVGGNSYGGFGVSPISTVTYYHNNDIVVFSLDSTGTGQWYQALRKKQLSDNDGGYYLSYGLMIAPQALYFLYNDDLNGEDNLSYYSLDGAGNSNRADVINADRKNLGPIPREAKQIGLKKYALPSLRKGYFQLITITF